MKIFALCSFFIKSSCSLLVKSICSLLVKSICSLLVKSICSLLVESIFSLLVKSIFSLLVKSICSLLVKSICSLFIKSFLSCSLFSESSFYFVFVFCYFISSVNVLAAHFSCSSSIVCKERTGGLRVFNRVGPGRVRLASNEQILNGRTDEWLVGARV